MRWSATLIASMAIIAVFLTACSTNESSVGTNPSDVVVQNEDSMNGKITAEDLAEMAAFAKNQALTQGAGDTITYTAALCPDTPVEATCGGRFTSVDNFAFFSFRAEAGATIVLNVNRVDCDFDGGMTLYKNDEDDAENVSSIGVRWANQFGNGGGLDMTLLTRDDDTNPATCGDCGEEPEISYDIAETGTYTVAVYRTGTCNDSENNTFEITVSGSLEGDDCVVDSDGDGIPDDEDDYPNSDTQPIVTIDGCDSGIDNIDLGDGAFMMDKINECAESAANHGAFVSCVNELTNEWKKEGLISGKQKSDITGCASGSNIP